MSLKLTEPKRKRTLETLRQPLPIPIGNTEEELRPFVGELGVESVVIHFGGEALLCTGYYGTGGANTQFERRKTPKNTSELLQVEQVNPNLNESHEEKMVVDQDETLRKDPSVYLDFYESFFLSYALGCLSIYDTSGEHFNIDDLWSHFVKNDSTFPSCYATYHYFRSKGWVVKSGIKFGADFVLYKWGPPFYHASYSVLVTTENDCLSWRQLFAINRVSESAAKELLIARVCQEAGFFQTPDEYLKSLKIDETIVKRWVPSSEREEYSMG